MAFKMRKPNIKGAKGFPMKSPMKHFADPAHNGNTALHDPFDGTPIYPHEGTTDPNIVNTSGWVECPYYPNECGWRMEAGPTAQADRDAHIAQAHGAPVYGCMDPTATNYNPNATQDDGSCQFQVSEDTKTVQVSPPSGGGGTRKKPVAEQEATKKRR